MELITEVHETNVHVCGARKAWRELHRQGHGVARCTVERLMRDLGITGAVRGKKVISTIPDGSVERAPEPGAVHRKDSVPKWIQMEGNGSSGFHLDKQFENPDHADQQVRRARGIQ
ncbi:IS3 family transposase [Streptomyces sp. NBC_00046]|uniref:IS3 family transposase n=1 Tax=unclassified Streptomyces TaxID=2593676 RepID=UPI003867F26E